jgi:hypothetical protein
VDDDNGWGRPGSIVSGVKWATTTTVTGEREDEDCGLSTIVF